MATNILLKKSSVAAKAPGISDLEYGELALNYADGRIYFKSPTNTIEYLGAAGTTVHALGITDLTADTIAATGDITTDTDISATGNITADTNISAGGNIVVGSELHGPATFTIDPAAIGDNTGTVVIAGDLQVDGTTLTINSKQSTTVGENLLSLADPDAITFLQVNADNTISTLDADATRIAIGTETSATGSAIIPVGTTAERDDPAQNGYFRYSTNVDTGGQFEGYIDGEWVKVQDEKGFIFQTSTTDEVVVIDSLELVNYRSAIYQIQVSSPNGYQCSEVTVIHTDDEVFLTESGISAILNPPITYTCEIEGSSFVLKGTVPMPVSVIVAKRARTFVNTGSVALAGDIGSPSANGLIDLNEGSGVFDMSIDFNA